jgi:hypothetical protein
MTFADARRTVLEQFPDYRIARWGYETDDLWLLIPLPETAGGRIAMVDKETGVIDWINENSDDYSQERPAGASRPGRNAPRVG